MINLLQAAAIKAADKSTLFGRFFSRRAGSLSQVLATLLAVFALAAPMAGPASAQTTTVPAQSTTPAPDGATTVATHADWTVRCGPNPQTQTEVCYMVQQVTSNDTGRAVLQVAIGKFGPDKRDVALVTLPLGVRLPPGVAIEVTGKEQRKRPFERCLRIGCQAQLPLDDVTLNEFKAGIGGRILFQDATGRTIALPFSLKGFTAAFAGVK
ncbi:invasion associated locus B family protein [Pelagibius sp. Alg239-R121]|uniref:invasion associated locus B family protein n=1 Tax=Pelagibius sp. Alg239-R121 TaxID=2993448 RepID=UPI0024A749F8|nr:invasion associated locus B family protein [Pelagibius sp. Alg239-R121]